MIFLRQCSVLFVILALTSFSSAQTRILKTFDGGARSCAQPLSSDEKLFRAFAIPGGVRIQLIVCDEGFISPDPNPSVIRTIFKNPTTKVVTKTDYYFSQFQIYFFTIKDDFILALPAPELTQNGYVDFYFKDLPAMPSQFRFNLSYLKSWQSDRGHKGTPTHGWSGTFTLKTQTH